MFFVEIRIRECKDSLKRPKIETEDSDSKSREMRVEPFYFHVFYFRFITKPYSSPCGSRLASAQVTVRMAGSLMGPVVFFLVMMSSIAVDLTFSVIKSCCSFQFDAAQTGLICVFFSGHLSGVSFSGSGEQPPDAPSTSAAVTEVFL